MEFRSKGLGKKTIRLYLSKGESIKSGELLYLRGQMEAPVEWEYIMPMRGGDIVDFFALLKDPSVAAFIHQSPKRWQLYGAMIVQGLALAGLVIAQAVRHALGRVEAEQPVVIEVPPPSVLKKKRKKKAAGDARPARKPYRRRLGRKTTSAPSISQGMKQQHFADDEEETVDDAIQDAMRAASLIGRDSSNEEA
jgi:hypothetical protein